MNQTPEHLRRRPQPYHFFIIHAGADVEAATTLHRSILRLAPQANVFLASETIALGECWLHELRDAMARTQIFVVLVSPALDEAHYAQSEIASAITYYRSNHRTRIIPIFLAGSAPQCTYGLANIQGLHVRDPSSLEDIAPKLIGSLLPIVDPLDTTTSEHLLGRHWRAPPPAPRPPPVEPRRSLPALLAPLAPLETSSTTAASSGSLIGLLSTVTAIVALTTALGVGALRSEPDDARVGPLPQAPASLHAPRPSLRPTIAPRPSPRPTIAPSPDDDPDLLVLDDPEDTEATPPPAEPEPPRSSKRRRRKPSGAKATISTPRPRPRAAAEPEWEYRTYHCLVGPDDDDRAGEILTNEKGQCSKSDRQAFLPEETSIKWRRSSR